MVVKRFIASSWSWDGGGRQWGSKMSREGEARVDRAEQTEGAQLNLRQKGARD